MFLLKGMLTETVDILGFSDLVLDMVMLLRRQLLNWLIEIYQRKAMLIKKESKNKKSKNKKYLKKMQSLMRPHQHAAQSGNLKDAIAEDVLIKVMSETLILGWDNVIGRDGEELEFTVENCSQLLRDLPELRDVLWAEANKVANYISMDREDAVKNS